MRHLERVEKVENDLEFVVVPEKGVLLVHRHRHRTLAHQPQPPQQQTVSGREGERLLVELVGKGGVWLEREVDWREGEN